MLFNFMSLMPSSPRKNATTDIRSSPVPSLASMPALVPHMTLKQSASCTTIQSYKPHDEPDHKAQIHGPQPGQAFKMLLDAHIYGSGSPPLLQAMRGLKEQENSSHDSKSSTLIMTSQTLKPDTADIIDLNSNAKTRGQFQPRRTNKGTTSYQLRQFAEATLGSGSLRKAVKLPEGEDLNEWLAVNVVDFYNQINLLYGSITEFCSPTTCPEMKATDEFEYLWQDPPTGYPKPTKMSAPLYTEHLLAWVQSLIDNESVFPSRIGAAFPKDFASKTIKTIFKRLYRIYAHIYCHHYPVIVHLGLEPHLNTSFKHYVLFVDEFQLEKGGGRDWWGPLGELVESMLKSD